MATAAKTTPNNSRTSIRNILFLTDFSDSSEAALPFATAIARGSGATIHALHVLLPETITYATPETIAIALDAQDENARLEMDRLNGQLAGTAHEVSVVRSVSMWEAVEEAIRSTQADLLVLGTHGRTGAQKLLFGSVAESIFRRSQVPVLTIGPGVRGGVHSAGRFRTVLYATDFTPHSLAAAPYAISIAEENDARLILFHAAKEPGGRGDLQESAAFEHATRELEKIGAQDGGRWSRRTVMLGESDPAEKILEATRENRADLIVLGVRNVGKHTSTTTHLGRAVAHKVVAHANCPVLTVRG
jgi:nucleotide-binding universal stress UspA family protein